MFREILAGAVTIEAHIDWQAINREYQRLGLVPKDSSDISSDVIADATAAIKAVCNITNLVESTK